MADNIEQFIGKTGALTEEFIQDFCPSFSFRVLADTFYGVDDEDRAMEVSQNMAEARVWLGNGDSVGADVPVKAEDYGTNLRMRILSSFSNDREIVVRDSLAATVSGVLSEDGVYYLPVESQAAEVALKVATVHAVGVFMGRQVYKDIEHNFAPIPTGVPHTTEEVDTFYELITDDVRKRDVNDTVGDLEVTDVMRAQYLRELRSERFCAKAGWMTLHMVDPLLNYPIFEDRLKTWYFDRLSEIGVPNPKDLAALYPLNSVEFNQLCSYIKLDRDVEPIDKFKPRTLL